MGDDEIEKLVSLLSKLEPGFVPYPIFVEISRIVALPILEVIPLRLNNNAVEVLLLEREETDAIWAGILHTPGTVIRATDKPKHKGDNWPALQRIFDDELKNSKISHPYYVGSIFHESKRGAEQAQLYWVEVLGEPMVGSFYKVDDLPPITMTSQIDFIRQAANSFVIYKNEELNS